MFHVGQFVVCVDGCFLPGRGYGDEVLPKKGTVYCIRRLGNGGDIPVLLLEEILNPVREYTIEDGTTRMMEPGFGLSRFRPIKETSLDVFDIVREPTNLRVREFQDVRA